VATQRIEREQCHGQFLIWDRPHQIPTELAGATPLK
jgi:hypothetical protein